MKILSSAKINLNLKIHDGLQDNYHKIESDIIPVGIFDEIVIKESQKDQIYSQAQITQIEEYLVKLEVKFEHFGYMLIR